MRRGWQIAGDTTRLEEVFVISRFSAMLIATVLEWVFWTFRLGESPLPRMTVRHACMTRWFCIDKAKKRLGYAPLISLDDALVRGVEDCMRRRREGELSAGSGEGKAKEA